MCRSLDDGVVGRPLNPSQRRRPEEPLASSELADPAEPLPVTRAGDRAGERDDIGVTESPAEAPSDGLFSTAESARLRHRWEEIQAGFIDEPRTSVADADTLVAEIIDRLSQLFRSERAQMEAVWSRGDDVSTEDLRIALQRYRAFFERLLRL